jgi:uncharacterized protein
MLSSTAVPWDFALILIFLGLVLPSLGRRRVRRLLATTDTTKTDRLTLYAWTIAAQWLLTAIVMWRALAHGLSPIQLGLAIPNPWLSAIVALILSAGIIAFQVISLRRLQKRPQEAKALMSQLALKIFPRDDVERLAFIALVATVAVCEEVIYRGFAQAVFQIAGGGNFIVGIITSAVLFALAHLYQGKQGLASTFVIGVVLSAVRAWTGGLIAPVVGHFVTDLTAGLIAPKQILMAKRLGGDVGQ